MPPAEGSSLTKHVRRGDCTPDSITPAIPHNVFLGLPSAVPKLGVHEHPRHPDPEDPRERRALARFAAVQAVLQARQRGLSLSRALHEAAQQAWDGRFFSADTSKTGFTASNTVSSPPSTINPAATAAARTTEVQPQSQSALLSPRTHAWTRPDRRAQQWMLCARPHKPVRAPRLRKLPCVRDSNSLQNLTPCNRLMTRE